MKYMTKPIKPKLQLEIHRRLKSILNLNTDLLNQLNQSIEAAVTLC